MAAPPNAQCALPVTWGTPPLGVVDLGAGGDMALVQEVNIAPVDVAPGSVGVTVDAVGNVVESVPVVIATGKKVI